MKKLILTLLIVLPAMAWAQEKDIDGFMGSKWGATKTEVAALAKARGGKLQPDPSNPNSLTYTDMSMGGIKVRSTFYMFIGGKLVQGMAIFTPEKEPQIYDLYKEVRSKLSPLYGDSAMERDFKPPFKEGDDDYTAIAGGYAKISDNWRDTTGGIRLYINNDGSLVVLDYKDIRLIEAIKKTQTNDF